MRYTGLGLQKKPTNKIDTTCLDEIFGLIDPIKVESISDLCGYYDDG